MMTNTIKYIHKITGSQNNIRDETHRAQSTLSFGSALQGNPPGKREMKNPPRK